MRIDDENKVVWCSESEIEWYVSFNLSTGNYDVCDFKRIFDLVTEKGLSFNFERNLLARLKIVETITKGYTFKLEQPQEYYWRKKKEHLAWFEKIEDSYLIRFKFSGEVDYYYTLGEVGSAPIEMTETEARNLLKDDFDKFEKVECE